MSEHLDIAWDGHKLEGVDGLLEKTVSSCLEAEGITLPAYAQLRVTDDESIRAINRAYRGIDRATDVLSFPSTNCKPQKTLGQCEKKLVRERDETGRCFLGDVIISLPRAREQAIAYGHSLEREFAYLTAHALFHLMGYDHMQDADKERMRNMEEKALNQAGLSRVTDDELIDLAKEAMQFSYSPYSHFKVGAALLAKNGLVFQGCNVENASYGVSNCAERTALFKAVSEGAREFIAIAIVSEKAMAWPCGVCRQALNEFAPNLRVIVACGDKREEALLSDLLSHSFGPNSGMLDILGKE